MPYTGILIPFAVEISRASPLRMPIRNLVISRGDDTTLALTIYDADGLALDLTNDVLTLTVLHSSITPHGWGWSGHEDYGWGYMTEPRRVLWQAHATTIDPLLGTAQVTIPRETSAAWSGRYDMLLSLDGLAGGAILARGCLDVRRGVVLSRPAPPPPASTLYGLGAYDPPLGTPGNGIFDNIALLPTAVPGQGVLGQFRLG